MSLKMKKTNRNISSYIAYKIYFHTCFIERSNCAVSKFHCAVKVFTVNWQIRTEVHTFLIPYDYCGSLQWIIQEIKCFAFALVLYPFFHETWWVHQGSSISGNYVALSVWMFSQMLTCQRNFY